MNTQIQKFAEGIQRIQDKDPLPRKPPKAWNNIIPKLPEKKYTKNSSTNKVDLKEQDFKKILREIKEDMSKKFEEKNETMEKRCNDLERVLAKTMETIEIIAESFEKSKKGPRKLRRNT